MPFARRAEELVSRVALLQEGVCNLQQDAPGDDEPEEEKTDE